MGSLADLWKQCVRDPNDSATWESLLQSHLPLFFRIVSRVAWRFGVRSTPDLDDAIQEICLKLSRQAGVASEKIPQMDDIQLEAYLKASIANAAHDYFRARRARRRDVLATTSIDDVASGASRTAEDTDPDRRVLLNEIEHMVEGSPRDRNVFFLYYKHGWTTKEIAAIPSIGLTPKGVESLVFRMASVLRARVAGDPRSEGFSQQGA